MNSLKSINLNISQKLRDKEYRDQFFEEWANDEIALQLRGLRKKRRLRQVDVAKATGTQQSAISRLEQAEYSSWSFPTLLRIAKKLDARIKVILEPAEEVIRQYENFESAEAGASAVEARAERLREKQKDESQKVKLPAMPSLDAHHGLIANPLNKPLPPAPSSPFKQKTTRL